jgi:predicted nuclease with TOPRIM domain
MAHDPRPRHELHRRLEELLGEEAADTLMEALPPVPWDELATKEDLARLEERLNARLDGRIATLDGRIATLDGRIDSLEDRIGTLDERWTERLELTEHKLMAAFRYELIQQSRTVIASQIGAIVATGSVVVAAARLL